MAYRVAIVHDWLTTMRGGERLLESLCRLYPGATLFTLRYERDRVSPAIRAMDVRTAFTDRVGRLPLGRHGFRALLPLFPLAVESLPLGGYDLVLSSSHCVALGALAAPGALHVSYVHSPMRYAWDLRDEYTARAPGGAAGRLAFRALAHALRAWDAAASARADVLIANSAFTRDRIRCFYRRDAEVIEPPVDTRRFERAGASTPPEPGCFLVVSALVPSKRVELAVRAFAGRGGRLLVAGDGPERDRLRRLAGRNVELLGWVGDDRLDRLYGRCRAVIHTAVEDFGLVPVEAMAAGRPVVAFAEGGTADTVRDGETGVLFHQPTAAAVAEAIDRLERTRFDPMVLRAHARRFDRAEHERRLRGFLDACWSRHLGARAREAVHGAA